MKGWELQGKIHPKKQIKLFSAFCLFVAITLIARITQEEGKGMEIKVNNDINYYSTYPCQIVFYPIF